MKETKILTASGEENWMVWGDRERRKVCYYMYSLNKVNLLPAHI